MESSEVIERILNEKGYEICKFINKGGFGTCFLVHSLKYNTDFVCKVSPQTIDGKSKILSHKREINALINLNHPNIVRVYDQFISDNYQFIVLEYCQNGSLQSILKQKEKIPTESVIKYTRDIIEALFYMHSNGFAHCDIKPGNILIDNYDRAKLCDFGLSEFFDSELRTSDHFCGSINYMATEVIYNKTFDPFKADIWSLGITIYYLLAGRTPFFGSNTSSILEEMKGGIQPIKNVTKRLNRLIQMCLVFDASSRPTMEELRKYASKYLIQIQSEKVSGHSLIQRAARRCIIDGSRRLTRVSNSFVC